MVIRRKDDPQSGGNGKGRIKFRYMDSERACDFTVENVASESVAEGLRSIANALAGRTVAVNPPRQLPKTSTSEASTGIREEGEGAPAQDPVPEEEPIETVEAEVEVAPKPRNTPKPKAPKLLDTPKLTEAKVSLEDFMKQKHPTDMMDKYAVIAVWYKDQFQITDITIHRVFTAFKHLGIESELPTDLLMPLRNLTYNRKWFSKGTGVGTFTINWVGESEVTKMGAGATK